MKTEFAGYVAIYNGQIQYDTFRARKKDCVNALGVVKKDAYTIKKTSVIFMIEKTSPRVRRVRTFQGVI